MARPKKSETDAPEQGPEGAAVPAAFTFVGDKDGHGPDEITAYGLTFKKNGKPVEVNDERILKKLAGNSHFKAA